MSCRDLTELVTDYMEGRMSFMQKISFQFHVGMCSPCREYLRQMKLTVQTVSNVAGDPPPMPSEVHDELIKRFRDWKQT
jgi:predicted anti-sigma-YlaC factor YlaD